MSSVHPLVDRFLAPLGSTELGPAGSPLLVAVSGGRDSLVLLHLLRFHAEGLSSRLHVGHFDHAMRPESAADARWVAGLCRAWGLPLRTERAVSPPRSEAEARAARYAFLRRVAADVGATRIFTGHHADDQAETVLFRVLRGSGIAGLGGIPYFDGDQLVRPLLPFWREELKAYARASRLRHRADSTNRQLAAARNRIRHRLLPWVERWVAPGARKSLVRLAEIAREEEEAWDRRLAAELGAGVRREGETLVLARDFLRGYDSAVGFRVLRSLLRQFGIVLDRTGTRLALQFITDAPSGRQLRLAGGLRLDAEFDQVRVSPTFAGSPVPDEPLRVEGPTGEGTARIGGATWRVRWRTGRAGAGGGTACAIATEALRSPLLLRGRLPGDRIRTAGGTKSLKKLFIERRIARSRRERLPVLVDADGAVLWIPGVVVARGAAAQAGSPALLLSITDD